MAELLQLGHSESVALIHNRLAGTRDSRDDIENAAVRLQKYGWSVEIYPTTGPGHATELAANAKSNKHTVVIAAGGDGTVREAVKGIRFTGIPIGTFPTGTVNVLAGETKTPFNAVAAADALANGQVKTVDTGEVNGEAFLLNAGAMMDAKVFGKVQKPGRKKKSRGLCSYIIPILATVPFYKGVKGELLIGEEKFTGSFLQAWAGNTRRLAQAILRPEAQADDSMLEFTVFTGERGYQMVPHFLSGVLWHRGERPGSIYRRGAEMILHLEKAVALQADGDSLKRSKVIHTRVVPDSLHVLIPGGPNNLFSRKSL
jgi:diacylglycerol kinase family enzyme